MLASRLRSYSSVDILRVVLLLAVLLLTPAFSAEFYSIHSKIFITCLLAGFVILTIRDSVSAWCALILIALFFGNHPGGRFLEIFDFMLLTWVLIAEFVTRKSGVYAFAHGYEWLFFLSCLLSVVANRFLIKDMFNHIAYPYFILTSNETQPFYAIKMLIMTFTCICAALMVYRLYLQRGEEVPETIARFIFIASAIAIVAGILEVHNANVAGWLSRMRFFIDRDFGDSAPHTILPFFRALQGSTAAKGLFWNRGWFGVYLIAAFPFVLYTLHNKAFLNPNPRRILFAILFLTTFFYTLVLIGARGAFLAFTFSTIFYVAGLISGAKFSKILHFVPYLFLVFAIVFPLSVFIDRLKPFLDIRSGFFLAAFEIGFSNPIFGNGAEGFGWSNTVYLAGTPFYASLHSPHNQVLQVFSGQGLAGLICYVALLLFAIRSLNKSSDSNKNYLPLMSGVIAFLIYSSFQEWFYLRSVQILWWLLIGFCAVPAMKTDSEGNHTGRSKWIVPITLVILCAAPIAFAMRQPPKNFGFSPPAGSGEVARWRWVVGNEAWSEIPPETSGVKLQLRNVRRDEFSVTVEVPSVYKTTTHFGPSVPWTMLNIDLPESSQADVLKISCDRTWNNLNYKHPDDRKLCIAAHWKWIGAPVNVK